MPVIVNDLTVAEATRPTPYLAGMRSLVAIPLYDQGQSLNMVVLARRTPGGFDDRHLPEHVWMSNLFGRAAHTLVLSQDLRRAYDAVDRELASVAAIQRSLLPEVLPAIPTLDLAAHYQTSRRAGGDYYDFLPLPNGRWGILVADVSGHGTPAAVIMAVVHSLVLTAPADVDDPPGRLLAFVNDRLAARYTNGGGTFVTAFYGVYDPATRSLTYASAGHPSPLLRRACSGGVVNIDGTRGLPMGIDAGERYPTATVQLSPGDVLMVYTDGLSEARSPAGAFLGADGLSAVLAAARGSAADVLAATLAAVERVHRRGRPERRPHAAGRGRGVRRTAAVGPASAVPAVSSTVRRWTARSIRSISSSVSLLERLSRLPFGQPVGSGAAAADERVDQAVGHAATIGLRSLRPVVLTDEPDLVRQFVVDRRADEVEQRLGLGGQVHVSVAAAAVSFGRSSALVRPASYSTSRIRGLENASSDRSYAAASLSITAETGKISLRRRERRAWRARCGSGSGGSGRCRPRTGG